MYFDNAATTKVTRSAIDAMVQSMEVQYGNPSSSHQFGLTAERQINASRLTLAKYLSTDSKCLFFTSGATESSNMVLQKVIEHAKGNKRHMITTAIEHPSVLEIFRTYENKGFKVTYLPCDAYGLVSINALREALTEETFLVSIMMANNEVGSIQPIDAMVKAVKSYNETIFFHTDCVQGLGKLVIQLDRLGVDAASFSAHKLHGPKGVGLLFLKSPQKQHPLFYGGKQEHGLRSGTENVPGIIGFSEAIHTYQESELLYKERIRRLKQVCLECVRLDFKDVLILSPQDDNHLDAIVSLAFARIKSEVIVHSLESQGVYVSSGSACSSNKRSAVSHVVKSINVPKEFQDGVIRISFSKDQSEAELLQAMSILKNAIELHRTMTSWRKK